ncbi:MAG: winged helix-turn-helix domain-containing protein [Candidatus Bathyarchaeia archaeon]|jgi:predicted transcriptional regulator
MAKYRDGLGIISDILHAAGSGTKKTRIMGVANLSYRLFEKYLEDTVQIGFLRMSDDGFEVTEKGQDFLEKYVSFSGRYSKLESELRSVLSEKEVLRRMCQPSRNGKVKAVCGRKRQR